MAGRILEQGPLPSAMVAATIVKVASPKASDTNMANRGGRMHGVRAATGALSCRNWSAGQVGRGSRLGTESLRMGTITPTRGKGGNYKAR